MILFFCRQVSAQNSFESWQLARETNDTLVKVRFEDSYYDYFSQRRFSIMVNLEKEKYRQELKVSKQSKCGHLRIYFKDTILFEYDIVNYEINGLGVFYNFGSGHIICCAIFRDSELHGTLLYYTKSSEIWFIAKYRRGKFREFEYHKDAIDQLELNRFNDYIRFDPLITKFSPELVK